MLPSEGTLCAPIEAPAVQWYGIYHLTDGGDKLVCYCAGRETAEHVAGLFYKDVRNDNGFLKVLVRKERCDGPV